MQSMRHLLIGVAAAFALVAVGCGTAAGDKASADGADPKAGTGRTGQSGKQLVVGFSQIGAESGWRTANSKSIQEEAEKRGIKLIFSDAQQKQENQIKALKGFINQGVDVIMFSPVVESGWREVMEKIKREGIPVIVADRRPDVGEEYYETFIGSDFVEEGRRAAEWLAKKMNGKAVIAELQGTTGSAPAIDRKRGFEEVLRKYPNMNIVLTQTGDFTRSKGKQVMEAFLKTPQGAQINVLFAHNDDMALGAIQAIQAVGRKPGKDIVIVSIDGVRGAFKAMLDGTLNCTVECNPIIGPQLFDAVEKVVKGEKLPKRTVVEEGVFDQSQVTPELLKKRAY